MISHGKNVKVFCANANRPFAEGVCRKLWLPLGDCTVTTFADGEVSLMNLSAAATYFWFSQPASRSTTI